VGFALPYMLKAIIYKLGSDAKHSLRLFFIGLGLFTVAGGFIALGYYQVHWYQIIGLVIAIPALFFMIWGYIGILANRFSQIIEQLDKRRKRSSNHSVD
jgi:cytochrome b